MSAFVRGESAGGRVVWEFEGEPLTRREILIAREAFALSFNDERPSYLSESLRQMAAKRFPLPMVTRPRVVVDPHSGLVRWYVDSGGSLVHEAIGPEFMLMAQTWPTPERVALWADLLANPTETVEAEP